MHVSDVFFTPEGRAKAFELLFKFDGRITRTSYWLSWLLWAVATAALFLITFLLAWLPVLTIVLWLIFGLLAVNSNIAVGRKRLHDRGKSGRWLLIFYLGPVVCGIIGQTFGLNGVFEAASFGLSAWAIVELGALPGKSGPNAYGPDPLDPQAQAAAQAST